MKNITSLRNHLFDQLNRLAEANTPEDLEREVTKASSIVQVSETIIKSAEVENQFIHITRGTGSGFIPLIEPIEKTPYKAFLIGGEETPEELEQKQKERDKKPYDFYKTVEGGKKTG